MKANRKERARTAARMGLGIVSALVLVLTSACSSSSGGSGGNDSGGNTVQITFGATGNAINGILEWVAADQGYFAKHGIDAELVTSDAGVKAIVSGALQVALVGTDRVVHLANTATPPPAKIAGASMLTLPYIVVAGKDYTDPAQLKGQIFAISQTGSLAHTASRRALSEFHLSPSDVTFRQVGGTTERLAAVVSGAAAATVITPELLPKAEDAGLSVLLSLADADIEFASSVFAVSTSFADSHPSFVDNLRAALIEAHDYVLDPGNKQHVLEIIGEHQEADADSATVIAGYDYVTGDSKLLLPKDLLLTHRSVQASLDEIGSSIKVEDIVFPQALAKRP